MERAQLSQDINTVFDEVIHTVNNIPGDTLNKLPFEDSWTIGQVAEHIILCSRDIPDRQVKEAERPYNEKEPALKGIFLDMEQKSKAAPVVTPQLPPHHKKILLEKLNVNKIFLTKIIHEKDLKQLCLDMEFPFMGYLTRYEWLHFISVHTRRHLNQIRNIQQYLSNQ